MASMNTTSPAEIAWAAGIFEGEGNSRLTGGPRLKISMCDEDVILRFHRVIGFGRVIDPYEPGGIRKTVYQWEATGEEAVSAAFLLFPWLCERRARDMAPILMWRRRRARIAVCGTREGLMRHYRLGTTPCEPCRAAHREYEKARWHAGAKDKHRAYRLANKEKIAAQQRAYYQANKDRYNELRRARRERQRMAS